MSKDNRNTRPNYKTTFKCDKCKKIITKDETVFTKTSYGGISWLCASCAKEEGITN